MPGTQRPHPDTRSLALSQCYRAEIRNLDRDTALSPLPVPSRKSYAAIAPVHSDCVRRQLTPLTASGYGLADLFRRSCHRPIPSQTVLKPINKTPARAALERLYVPIRK